MDYDNDIDAHCSDVMFFFQAEDGIRDAEVTGVQTCALPIYAVAVTYTLNGGYGCGVTVAGLGFLLNNEMDDFAAKPGDPNIFGLVQGERNAIQSNKRPLSSMAPTIVLRDGKLFLVVGAPGGAYIPSAVTQVGGAI